MAINLEHSIDVSAPVEDVYNVWSQFFKFPDFMGNTPETEITEEQENKQISWQNLKGVRSKATVQFTALDDAHTTVTVSMHYPHGLGIQTTVQDASRDIQNDLARFARSLQGQPAAGLQEDGAGDGRDRASQDIGADVLGPAYAVNPIKPAARIAQDFAQTLEKNLDNAASVWISSLVNAFVVPLNEMWRLTEQFDKELGSLMWGGLTGRRKLIAEKEKEPGDWTPDIDVSREGPSVKVTALLPGATEDDIEVEVRNGQLVISGECNFSEDGLSSTHFHESIDLLNVVDSTSIEAQVDAQGLLVISLKLHQEEDADAMA